MKLRFLLFISIIGFLHSKVNAKTTLFASDTTKIIVSCMINDADKMYSVKKSLIGDPKVNIVSFCTNHSVYLINYLGTSGEADVMIYDLRKSNGLDQSSFYIKEYSFGDLQNFCETDPNFL